MFVSNWSRRKAWNCASVKDNPHEHCQSSRKPFPNGLSVRTPYSGLIRRVICIVQREWFQIGGVDIKLICA